MGRGKVFSAIDFQRSVGSNGLLMVLARQARPGQAKLRPRSCDFDTPYFVRKSLQVNRKRHMAIR